MWSLPFPFNLFISPIGILSVIMGISFGVIISKRYSYSRATFWGITLSILSGLVFGLAYAYYANSLCTTFDDSSCGFTQLEILQKLAKDIPGNLVFIFLQALAVTLPGIVGVLIGVLITKILNK